jgi:hypothetical protein
MMPQKLSLQNFQSKLFNSIHTGKIDEEFLTQFLDNCGPPMSLQQRFMIYHLDYKIRLLDLLNSVLPEVKSILGTQEFRCLCEDYISKHPPTEAILGEACLAFPEFLQHRHPDLYEAASLCLNEFLAEESLYESEEEWRSSLHTPSFQDPILRLNKSAHLFLGKSLTFVSIADASGTTTLSFNKAYFHLIIPFKIPQKLLEIEKLSVFQDQSPEFISTFFKEMTENRVFILQPSTN